MSETRRGLVGIRVSASAARVRRFPFLQLFPPGCEILGTHGRLAIGLVEGLRPIGTSSVERVHHAVIVLVAGVLEDPILFSLRAPVVAGELDNQSFAEIGRAMGAEGIVVDRLEDVGPALKRAIDLQMNHGKTTIIEIMCTRELGDPFRRDALAKPVRMLDKYKDYV